MFRETIDCLYGKINKQTINKYDDIQRQKTTPELYGTDTVCL